MHRRLLCLATWLLLAGVAACVHPREAAGSRADLPPDAGLAPTDAGSPSDHPLGDCSPTPGAPGNALHVGQYCTKKGNQCEANPKGTANACATDLDRRGGNYCVKVYCSQDSDCGEAACCVGNFIAKACVPVGCLQHGGTCPK